MSGLVLFLSSEITSRLYWAFSSNCLEHVSLCVTFTRVSHSHVPVQVRNDKQGAVLLKISAPSSKHFMVYRPNTGLQPRAEKMSDLLKKYSKVRSVCNTLVYNPLNFHPPVIWCNSDVRQCLSLSLSLSLYFLIHYIAHYYTVYM